MNDKLRMDDKWKMSNEELAEFLSQKSEEIMGYITRNFTRELSKDDLSLNQYNIIKFLTSNGEAQMGQIAESLNVTAPAITTLIDKLEKEGYVERLRDDSDRRVIKVKLADKGHETLLRVRQARVKMLAFLLARMAPEEKTSWAKLYERISTLLKETPEELTESSR